MPLYLKGAGVAPGKYADLVRPALELLAKTDPVLLEEASFTPDQLDELAFDPRAHDHFHPVNKRPNVLFGEWDPHTIDGRGLLPPLRAAADDARHAPDVGRARRPGPGGDRAERLFEAAAVLAGTILMGAGVSGAGPSYHDSTVTLSKLVPRIARYRDAFYQRLLKALPGPHGERLREEAEKRQQPFAGVRQYLNQAIATQRAAHLQDRRLAQLFAAMGYPDRGARAGREDLRAGGAVRHRDPHPADRSRVRRRPQRAGRRRRRCWAKSKTCSAAGSTAGRSSTRGTSSAIRGCSRSSPAARTPSATRAPRNSSTRSAGSSTCTRRRRPRPPSPATRRPASG